MPLSVWTHVCIAFIERVTMITIAFRCIHRLQGAAAKTVHTTSYRFQVLGPDTGAVVALTTRATQVEAVTRVVPHQARWRLTPQELVRAHFLAFEAQQPVALCLRPDPDTATVRCAGVDVGPEILFDRLWFHSDSLLYYRHGLRVNWPLIPGDRGGDARHGKCLVM